MASVKKFGLGPGRILVGVDAGTVTSTVASDISATDTEIQLASTADFNLWGGIVLLDNGTQTERIYYATKDDTTNKLIGCIRGFDGTTALAWTVSTATPINASLLYKDLGDTHGGVKITASESSTELKTDQAGDTPVDEVISGTAVSLEGSLAQLDLENFALIFKTSVQTNSAGYKYVEIKPNVGVSVLGLAKKVKFIPYKSSETGSALSTDPEDQFFLRLAGVVAKPELTYDSNTQRALNVTFKGFPDATGVIGSFGADPQG